LATILSHQDREEGAGGREGSSILIKTSLRRRWWWWPSSNPVVVSSSYQLVFVHHHDVGKIYQNVENRGGNAKKGYQIDPSKIEWKN